MRSRTRMYGGRSAEERRAERRRRLLGAALEIWGEQGWAAVTMRGVCARAQLTDRYFYENFADRDALLVAAWDQLRDETVALLLDAIERAPKEPVAQLRAAIEAFVRQLTADPSRARIAFGEHAGSDALERRRRDTLRTFTDLLIVAGRPYFRPDVDEDALRMSVLMGIGGFVELITAWHAGAVPADAQQIIDHSTKVGATLAIPYLP
ncbi:MULTISPECIES: TetR/AcrR family transcriptional regulator [Actinomadura]|uniref:TetR/AcrR family transcriptional regulator n=1 Tax=Actinomadura yumaensis TaxID=111807 RepID=A0ABW2CDZ0_9ACTN|nr:TetR/AcrR family transcriptional regulator [Actinomadura sp. J1-007]